MEKIGCWRRKTVAWAGLLALSAAVQGQPANDRFANRQTLEGTNLVVQGTTRDSTREPGDPSDLVKNVWWSWTSPLDGVAAVWVGGYPGSGGSEDIHQVACRVFVGSELGSLTLVAETPGGRAGGRVVFLVRVGQTYQLSIGPPRGADDSGYPGNFGFILQAGVPPENDSFRRSRGLQGSSAADGAESRLAGLEEGEPVGDGQSSLWWHWTAPDSGNVVIGVTQDPGAEPGVLPELPRPDLGVFLGDAVTDLDPVPAWWDISRTQPAVLQRSFLARAGQTYRVRVGGFFGVTGRFRFNVAQTLPPQVRIVEPSIGRVFHAGEPIQIVAEAGDLDGRVREVEFHLISPNGSSLQRTTTPFHFQTVLAAGVHSVHALAIDDRGSRAESAAVQFTVRPANDDFARRTELTGWPIDLAFSAEEATREVDEPLGGSDRSVWWSWRASRSGRVTLSVTGGWDGGALEAGVYVGPQLPQLRELVFSQSASVEGGVQVSFEAAPGADYAFLARGGSRLRLVGGVPPTVQLTELSEGDPYLVGNQLKLRCTVGLSENKLREVRVVESVTGTPIAAWTNSSPSFELLVPLESVGSRTFRAVAIDENGLRGESSEVTVVSRLPPLTNDAFAKRIPLTGAPVKIQAMVFAADSEPGDPLVGSAWWSWAPRTNGVYTFSVRSPSRPYFELLAGTNLAQLRRIAQPRWDASSWGRGWRLTVEATVGIPYVLAVAGDNFYPGPAEISILPGTPPGAKWGRARAQRIDSESIRLNVELEAGDPDGDLDRVELLNAGEVIATLREPPFTTSLLLPYLAGPEEDWLYLSALAVDAQGLESPLEILQVWAGSDPIPNDDFADRTQVTGTPVRLSAPLQGATMESTRPDLGRPVWWEWTPSISGPHSIVLRQQAGLFYRLRLFQGEDLSTLAPVPVQVVGTTQAFEARLGERYILALDGNGPTVVEILPYPPPWVELSAPTSGADYREGDPVQVVATVSGGDAIRRVDVTVDGMTVGTMTRAPFVMQFPAPLRSGALALRLVAMDEGGALAYSSYAFLHVLPRVPINDAFENRLSLEGSLSTVVGTLKGSSMEPLEPSQPGWGSVWWTWRAPGSGPVWLFGSAAPGALQIEVFSGDGLGSLIQEATVAQRADFPGTGIVFAGLSGKRYQIRCSGPAPFGADLKLSLVQDAPSAPAIAQLRDGRLQIQMQDAIDRPWQLQGSEDLVSWRSLGDVRSSQGWLRWASTEPLDRPRGFYRLTRQ